MDGHVLGVPSTSQDPHHTVSELPELHSGTGCLHDACVFQPEDLLKEQFIVRESSSGTLDALRQGLEWHDLSLDHLNRVMTLGNAEAIRMAVQEGIGIAFVSAMVALEAVETGKLAVVEVDGLELEKTLYMAYDTDRPATRAQSAFWDWAFDPGNEHIRQRPTLRRV